MTMLAGASQVEAMILQSLASLEQQVAAMADQLDRLKSSSQAGTVKDWYTTSELAAIMGVTGHTVRERWCNQGRIECAKDSGHRQMADSGARVRAAPSWWTPGRNLIRSVLCICQQKQPLRSSSCPSQ